ncbi:MAG: rod shape-determining protein MreD, partial [Clostridia bacterium]|nr:rod shape-determining protein MreD [Clostridia bacterium]
FGLLQDIFFGEIIGVAAFIYFTIGIVVNDIKGYIYKDTVLSSILITAISVTYYHFAYWLLMRLFDMNISFMYILTNVYVIEIFYDILVGVIIYKILFNKLYTYKYK